MTRIGSWIASVAVGIGITSLILISQGPVQGQAVDVGCFDSESALDQPDYRPNPNDSVEDAALMPPIATLDSMVVSYDPRATVESVMPLADGTTSQQMVMDAVSRAGAAASCLPTAAFYVVALSNGKEVVAGGPGAALESWDVIYPGFVRLNF